MTSAQFTEAFTLDGLPRAQPGDQDVRVHRCWDWGEFVFLSFQGDELQVAGVDGVVYLDFIVVGAVYL